MGWRASSGHIYGYILFLFQLNYAIEWNIALNGKGFRSLIQLEYVKYCEFEKKCILIHSTFFFLSIAVVLFSFCFVKRLVIYIVYQKLIHVVFSWHFKQNVAHSSLCLFVFPDPHVHSDIFRLFSFGKQ